MGTLHEDIAERLFEDVAEEPKAMAVIGEYVGKLKRGELGPYADAIGQAPGRFPIHRSMPQTSAWMRVHAGVVNGETSMVTVDVAGHVPGPDKGRAANAAALAHVRPPFHAELDMEQNGADYDGTLTWNADIYMRRSSGLRLLSPDGPCDDTWSEIGMPHRQLPGWAPLEVGFTQPSRTLMHLTEFGAVARWPYGHDRITLLVNRDGRFTP